MILFFWFIDQIDGDSVYDNKDYWNQFGTSTVKPIEENPENKSDTAIFEKVMFDSRKPDYDLSPSKFWSLTAKNPIKRVRDYNEKFDHNMPVPVVHNDEVVYTFEGPQLYFNLVNMIIRMEEKVDFDDPEFLKLVVDHIQLFERHWRKMVVDIRKGTLDRNLPISEEARAIFESANLPRPKLATQLDIAFRNLGFHKKVLGKDIQIRPYAEKKPKKSEVETVASHNRRKRSLPSRQISSRHGMLESLGSPQAEATASTDSFGLDAQSSSAQLGSSSASFRGDMTRGRQGSVQFRSPSSLSKAPLTPDAVSGGGSSSKGQGKDKRQLTPLLPGTLGSPSGGASLSASASWAEGEGEYRSASDGGGGEGSGKRSRSTSRSPTRDGMGTGGRHSRSRSRRPSSKRELLAAMTASFKGGAAGSDGGEGQSRQSTTEGGSRVGTAGSTSTGGGGGGSPEGVRSKRRGSHADSQRPASSMELDALHYEQLAAARVQYKHTVQMDGDRFVCPFPACGKSFHSRDAAFRHLPEHEQRTRLYAPTPLSDSHLNFYWPRAPPWLDAPRFSERTIPPGSLPCPIAGCAEVFATRARLDAHLKAVHMKMDPSTLALGYFNLVGQPTYLPPGPVPDYLRCCLRWCPLHALPLGKCPVCVEIEALNIPKPPFKLFDAVSVDFSLRHKRIGKMLSQQASPAAVAAAVRNPAVTKGNVILRRNEGNLGVIVNKLHFDTGSPSKALIKKKQQQQQRQQKIAAAKRDDNEHSIFESQQSASAGKHTAFSSASSSVISNEFRGRPVAMLLDRLDKCWIAVEVLYTHQDAARRDLLLPPDFNKRYELARPLAYCTNTIAELEAKRLADEEEESGSRASSRASSSRMSSRGKSVRSMKTVNISSGVVPDPEFYSASPGTVLRLLDGGEEELRKYVRWVPLHCIERTFDLVIASKEDVQQMVRSNTAVLLRNTCFVVTE